MDQGWRLGGFGFDNHGLAQCLGCPFRFLTVARVHQRQGPARANGLADPRDL
jgi:hypothetical protein